MELAASRFHWSLNPAQPGGMFSHFKPKSVQLVFLSSSLSLSSICQVRTLTRDLPPRSALRITCACQFLTILTSLSCLLFLRRSMAQRTSSHHVLVQPDTCFYLSISVSLPSPCLVLYYCLSSPENKSSHP